MRPLSPLTDLEALMLEVRRTLFGDEIRARKKCQTQGCSADIEISFRVSEYLDRYRPRAARGVEAVDGEPGWLQIRGCSVKFRLVTAGDIAETETRGRPELELKRRTIRPEGVSAKDTVRVQTAMESMAPTLAQELEGNCPSCGVVMRYWFDPLEYVRREIRYEAEFLYHDVHVLAARYHWPEDKILALPRQRRVHYAELAMSVGGAS